MSYVNFKRPTELQGGPVICGQGFGLDHGDQGGTSRVGHDGQALRLYSEDITLNSPVEQSAPFGVMLQPKIALTANQATLAGLLTLDGVLLAAGDIVLLTAQSTTHQNGPWVVNANDGAGAATAWTRPKLPLFSGQQYHVQAGTESGKTWRLSTVGAIVLGSTALALDRLTTGGAGSAFDQTAVTSNLTFVKEAAHTVGIAASTTAATAGGALSVLSGNGNGAAGGALVLDTGSGSVGGAIAIGGTNGASVAIGRTAGANSLLADTTIAAGKSLILAAGAGGIDANAATGAIRLGAASATLGTFGVTAVARASAYTQTYATADKTHANPTMATLVDSSGGTAADTVAAITTGGAAADQAPTANAIATLVREQARARVDMADVKQLLNSVIDDLQAYGLLQ